MPRERPRKNGGDGSAALPTKTTKSYGNGANLGFDALLFLAADKLCKNLEPPDYEHVALGLIFLKHISNAFEPKRADLRAEDPAAAPDAKLIDDAMAAIEALNPGLKGVLRNAVD